jgi:hypothetical protein
MSFYPGTPPTRILSWSQIVRENDPNYTRLSLQPWTLEFSNGRLFVDPTPLYNYDFIAAGLVNNGGVLALSDAGGWPTSDFDLEGGDVYSNGGEPTIMGGFPALVAPPIFFGEISASALLQAGARGLPVIPPPVGSGILWNPFGSVTGGPIYIA